MMLSTGSVDNVKPELLLEAFYRFLGMEFDSMKLQIHRMDVYARAEDASLITLEDMGADILE